MPSANCPSTLSATLTTYLTVHHETIYQQSGTNLNRFVNFYCSKEEEISNNSYVILSSTLELRCCITLLLVCSNML